MFKNVCFICCLWWRVCDKSRNRRLRDILARNRLDWCYLTALEASPLVLFGNTSLACFLPKYHVTFCSGYINECLIDWMHEWMNEWMNGMVEIIYQLINWFHMCNIIVRTNLIFLIKNLITLKLPEHERESASFSASKIVTHGIITSANECYKVNLGHECEKTMWIHSTRTSTARTQTSTKPSWRSAKPSSQGWTQSSP